MKRVITLVAANTLISACGVKENVCQEYENYVAPEFQKEIKELKDFLNAKNVNTKGIENITIKFIESFPESNKSGQCNSCTKEILISEKNYEMVSKGTKKAVIAHEIGHCAFEWRGHDYKSKIMMPLLDNNLTLEEYKKAMEEFVIDLKSRGF